MVRSHQFTILPTARQLMRRWSRTPWTVGVAVGSIALGITAVTVVFAAVDALLLRPIQGTHAPALVRVEGAGGREPLKVMSFPEFRAIQASRIFSLVAAERVNGATVGVDGAAVAVGLAAVSEDYFATLGVRFLRGRGLEAGQGRVGAVVSEAFWRSRLGHDPDVVGRTLHIRGEAYPIVGVAGEGFEGAFPPFRVGVWAPLSEVERVLPRDGDPDALDSRFLNVLASRPAASSGGPTARPETALDARLDAVAVGLRDAHPFPEGRTFRVVSARGTHPGLKPFAGVVLTLMSAVAAMVLVVSSANVANLLLALGVARRGELALRACLGAERGRLLRGLLAESIVLGLAGSLVGVGASAILLRILSGLHPPVDVPLGLRLSMDLRVVGFASGVGALTGVVFGLWPALQSLRRAPGPDLGRGGAGGNGVGAWPQRALVVVQVLVTTVLLTTAGLMVRGLHGVTELDPGFRQDGVITVEADLTGWDGERVQSWWTRARQIVDGTPGVDGAALGLFVHLGGRSDQRRVGAAGMPREEWPPEPVNYSGIEGDLLELLDIPLAEGRTLGSADEEYPEVVVNRTLAERLWPEGAVVGRRLVVEEPDGTLLSAEVVGVTPTARYRRLNEPPTPFFYLRLGDEARGDAVLHVRTTSVDADEVVRLLQTRLKGIDAGVAPIVRRMTDHVTVAEVLARMIRTLLLCTAAAATLIALTGLFGVVSYLSARRRSELAVRLAVGATPSRVRRMVVWELTRFVVAGVAAGLLAGRAAAGALRGLLFAVGPGDPVTYAAVAVFVVAVAASAAWLPALRVTLNDRRLMATLRE